MNEDYRSINGGKPAEGETSGARPSLFWPVATSVALVAAAILGVSTYRLSNDVAVERTVNQEQFSRLSAQLAQTSNENRQLLDAVAQEARESASAAAAQARSDVGKSSASISARLAAQIAEQHKEQQQAQETQQEVAGQLDQLKQTNTSTNTKLSDLGTNVSGVRSDVDATRAELQQTGSDLKRVNGDLGVVSDRVATNGKELAELRSLGEREYVEFHLKRNGGLQKVAGIQLALAKADPKRNRFTLDVLADDKRTQKKDRTINEPVQLYVSGGHQPYEIVVNQVKKDEVVGYLSVPKVKTARSSD
jgi:septal ring factor EnvC (AmiA/AmiB activator)